MGGGVTGRHGLVEAVDVAELGERLGSGRTGQSADGSLTGDPARPPEAASPEFSEGG